MLQWTMVIFFLKVSTIGMSHFHDNGKKSKVNLNLYYLKCDFLGVIGPYD